MPSVMQNRPKLDLGEHLGPSLSITGSDYAVRTRRLILLIKELRAFGAEADFTLPRIAVIGNQSAGKSSLVEAISGITVPRASGTCTRCPMECRLTYDEKGPWQCQLFLRKETDADGNSISAREEKFGPLITDKADLEDMLRRAQLAILNPSLDSDYFVNFDTSSIGHGEKPPGSDRQLSFSNNVVCLDLSGPDVSDLSFIDLPGIISNVAKGEDRGNIDAVRNMVARHIQGNTLILLTITMRDDIDNQGAAHLARIEDEDGLRTIGVLTKPDLIQSGEEDAWLRILNGTSHPLKHGYFMTKQPSQRELEEKVSFEEARHRETEFFNMTSPWNEQKHLRERMGTPYLTKELSKLLGGVINKALPELRRESKASHQEVEKALRSLPPPPSDDPTGELLRMITSFSRDVSALIQGEESFERLIQRCRPAYVKLKRDIRRTAPQFIPFTHDEDSSGFSADFDIDPDDVVLQKQDTDETDVPDKMYLDDIRNHIEKSLTRELPFNIPFKAKVSLIQGFLTDWDTHCLACFDDVHSFTAEELKKLVKTHFGEFPGLLDHVDSVVEDLIDRQERGTRERIKWMLELENPPFTNNTHYFSSYRDKYLTKYKEARKPKSDDGAGDGGLQAIFETLSSFNLSDISRQRVANVMLGVDDREEDLIVMAETSAYFHVTYKRIIDNVPRIIDHDFLRAIGQDVQKCLMSGLGLGGDGGTQMAASYLAEDEAIAARRVALQQKKIRLKNVMDKLYRFGS